MSAIDSELLRPTLSIGRESMTRLNDSLTLPSMSSYRNKLPSELPTKANNFEYKGYELIYINHSGKPVFLNQKEVAASLVITNGGTTISLS